jgi:hypothetical protein
MKFHELHKSTNSCAVIVWTTLYSDELFRCLLTWFVPSQLRSLRFNLKIKQRKTPASSSDGLEKSTFYEICSFQKYFIYGTNLRGLELLYENLSLGLDWILTGRVKIQRKRANWSRISLTSSLEFCTELTEFRPFGKISSQRFPVCDVPKRYE